MTEEEWLAYAELGPMLEFLGTRAGERKRRLFACACCRRNWHWVESTLAAKAIDTVEKYADGRASDKRRIVACRLASRAAEQSYDQFLQTGGVQPYIAHVHASACAEAAALWPADHPRHDFAQRAANYAAMTYAHEMVGDVQRFGHGDWERFKATEVALQAATLRDVIGNPFRAVTFSAAWRTSDVSLLANGIYTGHAFDRTPILADALQDAGCDADDLLNHLRDTTATHVRGCWALDLVLGKE